jgi:hypothetical protein
MKKYAELSTAQKERAVQESLRRLLRAITEGGLRFNDIASGNDLQHRIDEAEAKVSHLPEGSKEHISAWRFHIMKSCLPELTVIARMAAHDAIYVEGDTVISLDQL